MRSPSFVRSPAEEEVTRLDLSKGGKTDNLWMCLRSRLLMSEEAENVQGEIRLESSIGPE